jgi:hypothetical protein
MGLFSTFSEECPIVHPVFGIACAISPATGEPHPAFLATRHDPEAIVLDLVNPACAGRRF